MREGKREERKGRKGQMTQERWGKEETERRKDGQMERKEEERNREGGKERERRMDRW